MVDLSVVIAVKNEEDNLEELVSRVVRVTTELKLTYEIIFVTDINQDNTLEVLKRLIQENNSIKTIKLSNSYGQYIAIMAGLHFSGGNAVVTMDGDLQDYPEDIAKLYAKLQEGYDVVYGVKQKKDDSHLRNFLSKSFIKVLNLLSDTKLEHNTNIFRIMTRRVAEELSKFKEQQPSLTGLTSLINLPTAQIEVTSGTRERGKTNYNVFKLYNLAINLILSFSTKPLRIISFFGLFVSIMSFFYMFYVIFQSLLFKVAVAGWPTIISLITFLGGIQLLAMGIIGEYIGRIFIEVKKRPLYLVEEKIGDFD